ncbi:MAG TPA: M20/M25/M40 family metallo-hydrolase [Pyrinomonadaceae bacterium]|nr:M20/M25/M40 family metallo-hydrolase [Pyrinomonadaceae bacterium]
MKFRQFIRASITLTLVSLLTIATVAQQPTSQNPSVDRLRQTIMYLASDALEGRRTGTQGANDAAHYIAAEFNMLGLRPGMQMAGPARTRGENRARYLQPFPYISKAELGKNNLLLLNSHDVDGVQARVGEDWRPLGFSSNTPLKAAEVTFVGYGISSAELKYDDYSVSNAKNRVAIVLDGTPDGDNPHGQFAQAGQIRFKAAAARAVGARALFIVSKEEKLSDDRLSRLSYDNAGEAGIPILVISRALAARLLPLGNLSEYEAFADIRRIKDSTDGGSQSSEPGMPRPLLLRTNVPSLTVDLSIDVDRRESPSFNVVGILPGRDPKLKNEAIVIGAHYDHLGLGGEGSLAPREGDIHHGADDNASGVAGLLELARMFSAQKPRRTIVFIAFSGEEEGLIGSNYYVNHPVVPLQNTVAMVNMDMIGRLKEKKLIVGGVGTASEWGAMLAEENRPTSLTGGMTEIPRGNGSVAAHPNASPFSITLNQDGYGPSDHSSFYAKQIPVLFFWTGTHNDYHKPSDTAEKINYEGEARIVSFVANIIRDIDKSDKRPTYTVAKSESQGRSTGFRVYLGTLPNYADSNDGLLLDGVREDSPAARAGLKAGDKIVKLAGRDVKNVYDYTYALGEMEAGKESEVELIRGGQRMTLKITPEKSRR